MSEKEQYRLHTVGLCLMETGEPFVFVSRSARRPFVYCDCCACTTWRPQLVDEGRRVIDEDIDGAWKFAPEGFVVPTRELLRELGVEDWIVGEELWEADGPWVLSGLILPWLLGEVAAERHAVAVEQAVRCVLNESVVTGSVTVAYKALAKAHSALGDTNEAEACEERGRFYTWAKSWPDWSYEQLAVFVDRLTERLNAWTEAIDKIKLLELRGDAFERLGNAAAAEEDREESSNMRYGLWSRLRGGA